ncbi:MAG TPA: plasmid stabilization protein [Lentisphaeria bacterium]|nr:MAG: plasmid stabilization protein [Lentisphaerae bacterium GWF2_50_93]HCE44745.1 plasmid stabilization protein [Lentisphaeria bacterium]
MKIIWTDLATSRVSEIHHYISLDSPMEADKWLDKLLNYTKRLETFPESGRFIPEIPDRKDLKELLFGNYRIIYKFDKKRVFILTVRHLKQILPLEEI